MFAIPPLATILGGAAILGPLLTYGWLKAEHYFDKRAAVASASLSANLVCAQRIDGITKDLTDAAAKNARDAAEAALAVPAVPADDAGLRRLCDTSASCRTRSTAR